MRVGVPVLPSKDPFSVMMIALTSYYHDTIPKG